MTYRARLRHFLFAFLAFSAGMIAIAGAQEPLLGAKLPSSSGSFLAGQQAFKDLRTRDASQYFLNASEVEWENPSIVERAFVSLTADGRVDDAAAIAQHLLDLDPDNEMAHLVLGTIALKERRYASAIGQLENSGGESFIGLTSNIVRAWALVGDEKYGEAEVLLEDLGKGRLSDFLIFHRALMADVAGEREIAIDLSGQAYEVDRYVARVVEAHARMLANASMFAEAKARG